MKRWIFLIIIAGCFSPSLFADSDSGNLRFRADPLYFSPNADGLQDQVFIYPVLKSNTETLSWRMDIYRAGKGRAARMTGSGFPTVIRWDGMGKNGQPAPDGEYIGRLKTDGRKKDYSAEGSFFIDTKKPEVTLSLSTSVFDRTALENRQLTLMPSVIDDSPIDKWLIQIIDSGGRTVQVFGSSGPVSNVNWDGTDRSTGLLAPEGSYKAVFQAWDAAGNESAPYFRDLKMNITAREMLERSLTVVQINETPMGLIVQLDLRRLFRFTKKDVFLTEEGQSLLRETAVLINAYPDAPVKLDGYSHFYKNFGKDRARASLYAWRVYSYLIKAGNVKASRLNVRGRGPSAMFDRRSITLPVLSDGVEVILEGNRQW